MDALTVKRLARLLPELRGALAPKAAALGCTNFAIRHSLVGEGAIESLINSAGVGRGNCVSGLSFSGSAGPKILQTIGKRSFDFPLCLIDTRARQIIVAGEASDVKSVLERLSSQLFELADQPIVLGSSVQAVPPQSMLGKIVAVTGGAGGIGLEIAKAFCSAGATVITLDIKPPVQPPSVGFHNNRYELCDVTIQKDVDRCFGKIAAELGGLDIVICNAGAAAQGPIGDVDIRELQKSFDLNFFAHHRVAQAALRIFRQQGMGGLMLFNISNQSVNLGSGFGPYGIAKAAELALMKQYALDHGHEGIRANGVNAGRIRSGLMTDEMIESRSSSRGVGVKEYMTANLLGVEVTSYDVAQAFLHLAAMDKVNAAVLTVDGGAMATSMR